MIWSWLIDKLVVFAPHYGQVVTLMLRPTGETATRLSYNYYITYYLVIHTSIVIMSITKLLFYW